MQRQRDSFVLGMTATRPSAVTLQFHTEPALPWTPETTIRLNEKKREAAAIDDRDQARFLRERHSAWPGDDHISDRFGAEIGNCSVRIRRPRSVECQRVALVAALVWASVGCGRLVRQRYGAGGRIGMRHRLTGEVLLH